MKGLSCGKLYIFRKICCLLGFHKKVCIGEINPFFKEVLSKCEFCGKYSILNTLIKKEIWFKKSKMSKYVNDNCLKVIKKHNL